ncbi:hypothetical protein V8E36_003640 [Tilletia maclaganii]
MARRTKGSIRAPSCASHPCISSLISTLAMLYIMLSTTATCKKDGPIFPLSTSSIGPILYAGCCMLQQRAKKLSVQTEELRESESLSLRSPRPRKQN